MGYEHCFHQHQMLMHLIEQIKAAGHGLKENSIDVMINPDNDFKIKGARSDINSMKHDYNLFKNYLIFDGLSEQVKNS